MGVALFLVLEKEIENLDAFVDGKFLARAEPVLAEIANSLGVKPLMNFYGADDNEIVGELLESKDEFESLSESSSEWFEAKEGLKTICALLDHLKEKPVKINNHQEVFSDLLNFKRVLEEAAKRNVRWHLEVDV
jgi:hypothetical protein